MGLHEIKIFCTTKEMVSKLKRQPTKWERIFASYTSNKGLINRMYKRLKQLNFQKINDLMKKWANELNRAFSKEVQIVEIHMKKCSTSLAIKEKQIKTTLRFHLTPVRTRIQTTTNVGKDLGRKEPSYTAGGNVRFSTMENSMEAPQKAKNRTALGSSNTTPRDIPKGM
jgi:hypothetical protein